MFGGTGTAVVTPFKEGGVDFESFGRFLNWQIEGGVEFLVVLGTTGESPTVTADERAEIITFAVKTAAGRVPVVIGTGTNSTANTIALSQQAEALGADGVLVVTPYYNKPTQEGLYQHFKAVAAAIRIPLIVYNVPGRTGTNILPETVRRLSRLLNVAGIKEAAGDVAQIDTPGPAHQEGPSRLRHPLRERRPGIPSREFRRRRSHLSAVQRHAPGDV